MIETLTIESFKSIQSVTLELGQVNVFIGANGSGKSNLLEALAVLSAAASGKVDQSTLVYRGCRASSYYRPMFEGCDEESKTKLTASGKEGSYDVTLKAPAEGRLAPWEFRYEELKPLDKPAIFKRDCDSDNGVMDPQVGRAALQLATISPGDLVSIFLKSLAAYSIYSADTRILHGWVKDPQEREPVGLGGGGLADALVNMYDKRVREILDEEFRTCIDWFSSFGVAADPISAPLGLVFNDRYFQKNSGRYYDLRSHDVNEGALYLTFLAVLGLHPQAPKLFAIENVDHGLNPLLAKRLMSTLTERILTAEPKRQVFLTTHNPLVLDGLPLGDDRVRLFTVDRDNKGHTVVKRFIVTDKHREMAEKGWTLSRMWINKLIGGVPDV